MALLMDEERVGDIGGLGCMGNEGVQWIGMSEFIERDHFFQNLGDGTFFHSGQLAIQASIAAGVHVTYKLLYNGTVAMTGGQDPVGQLDVAAVARALLNEGVARVLITTEDPSRFRHVDLPRGVEVWSRDRLIEAQELLAGIPGTTVLIHDQACAAEARRARKRGQLPMPTQHVVINPRICEGCGDCGRISNCLSVQPVETPFGRKTEIDQTTCNFDYSCLEGDCPSFMTVTRREPRTGSRWLGGRSEREGVERLARPDEEFMAGPTALPTPIRIVPEQDFAMRITGIGGTGVVTVAQVLGTAAMLDDYHVRGLDQIGLSQKAGPVVSDLRLSRSEPTSTSRLGTGQADLLLAFDQLVAASERGLRTTDPEKTTVVGSTTTTPTGEMITHLDVRLPTPQDLIKRIAGRSRADAHFWADAAAITEALFGDSTTANLFTVGMAVQAGCLPVDPARIEEAIALNGVSIERNQAAFRWGRAQVAMPERVEAACKRRLPSVRPATLHRPRATRLDATQIARIAALGLDASQQERVVLLGDELAAWGSGKDVDHYLAVLERVVAAEERARVGSRRLARAVAANLYKLMAYKDEYEVARLMTDAEGLAAARQLAKGHDRIAWKLHPPLLRALGLDRKITIGAWATPLVRMLARAKVLRGTPFDPFGLAAVRRVERALASEYEAALDRALASLDADHFEAVVELAELPDIVRGYESIKLDNVARYRAALEEALAALPPS